MMRRYTAFTLLELLMVLIIAGTLLGITFNLGRDYINFLKFKQDRETLITVIDTAIVSARTTNYHDTNKYTYLDMTFDTSSLVVTYGSGDASSTASCSSTGSESTFDTYTLTRSSMTGFVSPTTIRILPFQVACYSEIQSEDICSEGTGLSLIVESNITSHETCYSLNLSVCKLSQVVCP